MKLYACLVCVWYVTTASSYCSDVDELELEREAPSGKSPSGTGFSLVQTRSTIIHLGQGDSDIDSASTARESCGLSRNISQFAFYHISKCGGSTLNIMFKEGLLTENGLQAFRGEAENSCTKFDCQLPPDVFVIGAVRNPYSFYVSYWQMLLKNPDPYNYGCIGQEASRLQLWDIFNRSNYRNRTTFGRFVNFFVQQLPHSEPTSACDLTISGIYSRLMLRKDGSPAYDALVTLEDYWPSLDRALRQVDCLLPRHLDLEFFRRRQSERRLGDGQSLNSSEKAQLPYACFYSDESLRIVEKHDDLVFKRHAYNYEDFLKEHGGACSHIVF